MSVPTPSPSHGLIDTLTPPVCKVDHLRGTAAARVTVVEFGDYECPHCATAERLTRRLLERHPTELAIVFRHLPVVELHPHALSAALAAEAASSQGMFWEMHDFLFANQLKLENSDLIEYAALAGLDIARFCDDLETRRFEPRVRDCLRSASESGADRTPSFFLNGRRHFPLGLASLEKAIDDSIHANR